MMNWLQNKNAFSFFMIVLGIGLSAQFTNAALTHHYPVENETAGTLTDVVGTADIIYADTVDGVLSTDTPFAGSSQSFLLNAATSAATADPGDLFQAASFTAALWYREGAGGGSNPSIFGVIEDGGSFQHNFLFRDLAPNGGNLRFFSRDNSGNTLDITSSQQINDGGWHHLAATFDSTTEAVRLYVDGNLTGSAAFTGWTGWEQANQTFSGLGNPGGFTISGNYDDIRLYGNPLEQSAIQALITVPVLEIDRLTGTIDLINTSGSNLSITGYSITSAEGALVQSNWHPITGNYDASGDASVDSDAWSILTFPTSQTDLSEAAISAGNIADNRTLRLGDAGTWLGNPVEDLTIDILLEDGSHATVLTRFVGNGGSSINEADLNANGVVDGADWLILRGNLVGGTLASDLSNAELFQLGDMNQDRTVDRSDFIAFKDAYNTANGPGSFASMAASVPEPTTMVLALVAGLFITGITRIRKRLS